jgi:hypothetical protein
MFGQTVTSDNPRMIPKGLENLRVYLDLAALRLFQILEDTRIIDKGNIRRDILINDFTDSRRTMLMNPDDGCIERKARSVECVSWIFNLYRHR